MVVSFAKTITLGPELKLGADTCDVEAEKVVDKKEQANDVGIDRGDQMLIDFGGAIRPTPTGYLVQISSYQEL